MLWHRQQHYNSSCQTLVCLCSESAVSLPIHYSAFYGLLTDVNRRFGVYPSCARETGVST
jgi:hypothetical protein